MGLVVLFLLAIVFIVHGTFGVKGIRHLLEGFKLAKTRREIFIVSLAAAASFTGTMVAWGLGTTLFKRETLALTVGFGYLFLAMVFLFVALPELFDCFGRDVVRGIKAGVGLAIPAATLYYMIYMFYIPR